jgi:hypothetical protein
LYLSISQLFCYEVINLSTSPISQLHFSMVILSTSPHVLSSLNVSNENYENVSVYVKYPYFLCPHWILFCYCYFLHIQCTVL